MQAAVTILLILLGISSLFEGDCARQLHGEVSQAATSSDVAAQPHLGLDILISTRKLLSRPKHKDEVKFEVVEEDEQNSPPAEISLLFWCSLMAGILLVSLPIVLWRKRALK